MNKENYKNFATPPADMPEPKKQSFLLSFSHPKEMPKLEKNYPETYDLISKFNDRLNDIANDSVRSSYEQGRKPGSTFYTTDQRDELMNHLNMINQSVKKSGLGSNSYISDIINKNKEYLSKI